MRKKQYNLDTEELLKIVQTSEADAPPATDNTDVSTFILPLYALLLSKMVSLNRFRDLSQLTPTF